MLGQKKSFWGVVESFERSSTDFFESVSSIKSIPGIRFGAKGVGGRRREGGDDVCG